jgi:chromosome partitioning protein
VRTIAVINQKGGCGKTTTAVNLAASFASRRFRTLLIDMDPQSHCAAALGIPESQIERDISNALLSPIDAPMESDRLVWRISRGLDLVPSRTRLAGLEASRGGLSALTDREHRLRGVIDRLSQISPEGEADASMYDVCLIDCPPSIGLLTFNALIAASEIMIPVETSFFSMQGASKQMATIRSVSRRLGVRPKTRILATMHDANTALANDLLRELREKFGPTVIPTVIRHDQTLKSAASFGRPACDFAPESPGAQDYASLCEWLIEHSEIDRASAEEMLEFEGLEDLGRREAPSRGLSEGRGEGQGEEPGSPHLRANRPAAQSPRQSPAQPPEPSPEIVYTETISRLEDLTRRARALQRTAVEITPKPSPTDRIGPIGPGEQGKPREKTGPSDELLRGMFASSRPMLPPPTPTLNTSPTPPTTSSPTPSAGSGPQSDDGQTLTAIRAGARITSAVATLNRISRPVVIEIAEEPERESEPGAVDVVDSVRRLLGARRTSRGVLFVQPITEGGRLSVAGSFNGWCPRSHPMRRNEALGVFELQVELGPGQHEYKLVLDGRWVSDRYNPMSRPDDFGGVNSLVELPEPQGV